MSDNLNRALVLFVGKGASPFPCENEAQVVNEFGLSKGADLIARVRVLLAELNAIKPDWGKHDLITASKLAVSKLAALHPAIDEVGTSALEWCYSYWWK
jgi:hypothetical protein